MKFRNISFNSMRLKLMIIFSVAFLLLLILLLSLTKTFFNTYYAYSNEKTIRREVTTFVESLRDGNIVTLSSTLTKNVGGATNVFGEGLVLPMDKQVPGSVELTEDEKDQILEALEGQNADDFFGITAGKFGSRMLYARKMPRGGYIVIAKPMGLADEAQTLFFRFISLVALVVYVVGIVMTYIITRRLTEPILEMKAITKKMSELDFSKNLNVRGSDELGELMASINVMAKALSETIDALNQSNTKLEKELTKEKSLERMRRQFVSDVSHELKNPLAMILGYAEGLKQEIPKSDQARKEYYEIIIDEAERMNRIVRDLLDLSAYESGAFTIEKESFLLNELINDALERFRYMMHDKQPNIMYNADDEIYVMADRIRMGQVIANLVNNAIKHVDDNGIIKITAFKRNGGFCLTISNTGKLIPEGAIEDIWNSFYQVDTSSEGNGLGLPIVRSIVKLHGGSCRAYTIENMNCFEINID